MKKATLFALSMMCTSYLWAQEFITTWKTDNPGISSDTQITIPTNGAGYDYHVYWEEIENASHNGTANNLTGNHTIEFGSEGTYRIEITGDFPRIYFADTGDKDKILTVEEWGDIAWTTMSRAFYGCTNLTIPATDAPNLTNVTDMTRVFQNATSFNQNINHWDVSQIRLMFFAFNGATQFNQPLNNWDVSRVTNMVGMFGGATSFNMDIGGWQVGNVISLFSMFKGATAFNQDIGGWDMRKVTSINWMFQDATSFNQDLSNWELNAITLMAYTFENASSFNQNLSTWNISKVTHMIGMFDYSGMSADSYDDTLIGWAAQTPKSNVQMSALSIPYCRSTARSTLQNTYKWTITDAGKACDTSIKTFALAAQTSAAVIDKEYHSVAIEVTTGTDVSALTPTITLSSRLAAIAPVSDAVQDFSSPVIYTVTASDGSTQDWLVIVTPENKMTDILTFSLPNQTRPAAIDAVNHTVFVPVDKGSDLTSLSPVMSLSNGATVSPISGSAQNFTNPVSYTVTAADGVTTQDWIVKVEENNYFITTWNTALNGRSRNWEVAINTSGNGYNYDIYWEEVGNSSHYGTAQGLTGDHTLDFGSEGTYQVEIRGAFPQLYFHLSWDSDKLLSVEQWGDQIWRSMERFFYRCRNLSINATDVPDLSAVTNMSSMFYDAVLFNQDISNWDVSNVTNMESLFYGAIAFNQDISSWDISQVTNMKSMFSRANSFTQDITQWDVSGVHNMSRMFSGNTSFNQNIGAWDVSGVTDMSNMFSDASGFNQNLSTWDVSGVMDISYMFAGASSFNQDVSSWDVSAVVEMNSMFQGAEFFNQDLSNWDVSQVTIMDNMFNEATFFNQDISGWDVSQVENFYGMFFGATSFDQSLSNWDIGAATDMEEMFGESGLTSQNYDKTLIGWAAQTVSEGVPFSAIDKTYCKGATARAILVNTYNWEISDAGLSCSTETDILSFTLSEQTGSATIDSENHTMVIEVVSGTDLTGLVPAITVSVGATLSPDTEMSQDFTNPVTYSVTAEDGSTIQDWVVSVTKAPNHETDVLTFALNEQTSEAVIDSENHTISLEVESGTALMALAPIITVSEGATITPDSGSKQDFSKMVTYTVTAEDGSTTQHWKVVVQLEPELVTTIVGSAVINIYPNPAQDQLTINVSQVDGAKYAIYNTSGKMMIHGKVDRSKLVVDIRNLESGYYVLKVSHQQYLTTTKILISR